MLPLARKLQGQNHNNCIKNIQERGGLAVNNVVDAKKLQNCNTVKLMQQVPPFLSSKHIIKNQ